MIKTRFKHWNWREQLPIWIGTVILVIAMMHFTNGWVNEKVEEVCNLAIIENWCEHGG